MEWDSTDASDWRVVEQSGWRNLVNYTGLRTRAGVYVFANAALQVKYVGKAGPGRMVDEIANALYRGKDSGATRVKALYTNSNSNALSLERKLVGIYDPPNNFI